MTVFEAARQADCIRAAERLGLHMKRSGSKCYTRCLFHAEKTPSMCLYPGTGGFYCFGCNESGDAIKLYSQALNLTSLEAAKQICADFGLHYDGSKRKSPAMQQRLPRVDARTLAKRLEEMRDRRIDELLRESRQAADIMRQIEQRTEDAGLPDESVLNDAAWMAALDQRSRAEDEIERLTSYAMTDLFNWAKEEMNDKRKPE